MIKQVINLLVVDDDDVDRMAIKHVIKKADLCVKITEACTVKAGLDEFKKNSYDCAFIDYRLPDGDGLSMLRSVRSECIETQVIVLTGRGDEQLVVDMLRAGASDYITKDKLSTEVLENSIRNVIRRFLAEKERIQAELDLKKSNATIINILESISDAFFAINSAWEFTYVNKQAEVLLNEKRDVLLGATIWEKLPEVAIWFREKFHNTMKRKIAVHVERFYAPMDRWLEMHIYPAQDGLSVYFRDITPRKETEQRLNYLATHDDLTGLPNRLMLMDRLSQALSRIHRQKRFLAVLYLDLDRFKSINDTLGHNAGDILLKSVAVRLKAAVRDGDTIVRLGGDEFVVILADLAEPEHALCVAEKIQTQFEKMFDLQGQTVYMSSSIGISVYPTDGVDAESLVANADTAMYRAKAQGKNAIQLYSPSLTSQISERLMLESGLRSAFENDEFVLYFQPEINVIKKEIVGVEALIRWQHPHRGILHWETFLPIAEEIGMSPTIGKWVLNGVVKQKRAWTEAGYPNLNVAMNISNREFWNAEFRRNILNVLEDKSLGDNWLEIELTERVVIEDFDESISILREFQNSGAKIALDDFGTGYSSLAYMKRLPLNTIKIDQSFIADLSEKNESTAIVVAIIELARSLGLHVVAEGVETTQQANLLQKYDCNVLQGVLYCAPVPVDEFNVLLKQDTILAESTLPA